jgi:hypothetical protein
MVEDIIIDVPQKDGTTKKMTLAEYDKLLQEAIHLREKAIVDKEKQRQEEMDKAMEESRQRIIIERAEKINLPNVEITTTFTDGHDRWLDGVIWSAGVYKNSEQFTITTSSFPRKFENDLMQRLKEENLNPFLKIPKVEEGSQETRIIEGRTIIKKVMDTIAKMSKKNDRPLNDYEDDVFMHGFITARLRDAHRSIYITYGREFRGRKIAMALDRWCIKYNANEERREIYIPAEEHNKSPFKDWLEYQFVATTNTPDDKRVDGVVQTTLMGITTRIGDRRTGKSKDEMFENAIRVAVYYMKKDGVRQRHMMEILGITEPLLEQMLNEIGDKP